MLRRDLKLVHAKIVQSGDGPLNLVTLFSL